MDWNFENQMDIFDFLNDPNEKAKPLKITKPVRMIELFAGYGATYMAIKRLGIEAYHHFVCEFDKHKINFYNTVHGTNYDVSDIREVKGGDLRIENTDKYTYMLTYSFP